MPETRITTETVYTIQELDGKARETALSKLYEWATDYEWWDSTIEDAKRMGAILGIDTEDIYFSGFSSQGDGACFTGTYSYQKGATRTIRAEAPPTWTRDGETHTLEANRELAKIADALQRIERRNFYRLTAAIRQRSHHYSHEYTVEVDTDRAIVPGDDGDTGALADVLRDFMRWIYRTLETEYEYQTSEEQLLEMADANEYRFTSDGRLA